MYRRNGASNSGWSRRGARYAFLVGAAALALFAVPTAQASGADRTTAAPDQFTPLAATVLAEPHPVPGADGKAHLAYELLITNPLGFSVTVERVETLDARHPGRVLDDVTGATLDAAMTSVGGVPGRAIGGSQLSRVLLDVQLGSGGPVPRSLVHRLTVTLEVPVDFLPTRFLTAATSVSAERPAVLGPPLQGTRWVQFSGCCPATGDHRNAVMPVNGGLYAGQRFAVDIVQLDADGRLFNGPPEEVTSYPYYGTPVLAASSGVVVSTRNDLPDQIPFHATPVDSAVTILGNHVVVNQGDGRYVFYAHLKPGSVAVSVGDRVRQGQQLGRLGNSGNSDLPHLHIHVMAGASPLGSDGLPFVLHSFDSPGSVPPLDQIDLTQPIPIGPELRGHYERVIPMDRQVVDYPPVH